MVFFKTSDPAKISSFVDISDDELIEMGFVPTGKDGSFRLASRDGDSFKIGKDSLGRLFIHKI